MQPLQVERVPRRRKLRPALASGIALAVTLSAILAFVRTGETAFLIIGLVVSVAAFLLFSKLPDVSRGIRVQCPSCGRRNAEDARFCDACGKPI